MIVYIMLMTCISIISLSGMEYRGEFADDCLIEYLFSHIEFKL
ncbi:MAG: hypothetical protein H6Q69_1539 [Firmicutes bacterium]|nr:hypothetical protein [Bacillota bacterium]